MIGKTVGLVKNRNMGKHPETRDHDNGIVEVTGSIPVGSTNKDKGSADKGG
jgi:hypothetical protein